MYGGKRNVEPGCADCWVFVKHAEPVARLIDKLRDPLIGGRLKDHFGRFPICDSDRSGPKPASAIFEASGKYPVMDTDNQFPIPFEALVVSASHYKAHCFSVATHKREVVWGNLARRIPHQNP